MRQDEFIEQYGQQTWEKLVEPLQYSICQCVECRFKRNNANILIFEQLEEIRRASTESHTDL